MQRKVRHHTVFLAIDRDRYENVQVFINLVNLSPSSQSLATRVGFTAIHVIGLK